MSNKSIITLGVILAATLSISSCDNKKKQSATTDAKQTQESKTTAVDKEEKADPPCCHAEAPKAVEASEDSIYQLDSTWKNAAGKEVKLSDLGGKVQVLTMGYSTCKFACPKLMADMLIIRSKLPESIRGKVGFTFVSIDPEVDTPARLTEYEKENNLDTKQWTLLTSGTDAIQELAVVLGVQYRKTTSKDFAHSNIIVVLNKKGEILHRQEGLSGDPTKTVQTIVETQK